MIKIMWYWHKDKYIHRTEDSPETDPCINGQLIFKKGASSVKMDSLFNKWC